MDNLARKEYEVSLWEQSQNALRHALGDGTFCTWVETLEYLGQDEGYLLLNARNELSRNWVEKHYLATILQVLRVAEPALLGLRFEVRSMASQPKLQQLSALDLVELKPVAKVATPKPRSKSKSHSVLYPDYRFDRFVVGDCNRMAYSVARTVAEAPGDNHYNPLVVYGRSGLGKTHLLQAIGHYVTEQQTAGEVLYCTAEKFLKDFIRIAVQERRSEEFYRIYEAAEVLIIDDIQFLVGKERTQEELFKIFNRLLAKKKQIVLSCDQLPSELAGLDQRLLNRFESGLCCSMNPMDLQTRLDFLHRKASTEGFGLSLSEDSFRWLATHFRSNVRELEGVLVKLVGLREIMKMELNLENIRRMVGEVVRSESRPLSLSSISEFVANAFGIKAELLASKSRVQAIALPRKVAIKFCRELTDHSLEAIGFQFNRDYSTMIASLKSLDEQMVEDHELRGKVDEIRTALLG